MVAMINAEYLNSNHTDFDANQSVIFSFFFISFELKTKLKLATPWFIGNCRIGYDGAEIFFL